MFQPNKCDMYRTIMSKSEQHKDSQLARSMHNMNQWYMWLFQLLLMNQRYETWLTVPGVVHAIDEEVNETSLWFGHITGLPVEDRHDDRQPLLLLRLRLSQHHIGVITPHHPDTNFGVITPNQPHTNIGIIAPHQLDTNIGVITLHHPDTKHWGYYHTPSWPDTNLY